jgi:hypothetical protein
VFLMPDRPVIPQTGHIEDDAENVGQNTGKDPEAMTFWRRARQCARATKTPLKMIGLGGAGAAAATGGVLGGVIGLVLVGLLVVLALIVIVFAIPVSGFTQTQKALVARGCEVAKSPADVRLLIEGNAAAFAQQTAAPVREMPVEQLYTAVPPPAGPSVGNAAAATLPAELMAEQVAQQAEQQRLAKEHEHLAIEQKEIKELLAQIVVKLDVVPRPTWPPPTSST